MGEQNQKLFIWSGISAFLIYCFVVFFILFKFLPLFKTKYIPRTNTILEQAISISLSEPEITQDDNKDSGTPLEGLGVKDIFSTIPDSATSSEQSGDNRSQNAKNTKDKIEKNKLKNLQERLEKMNANINALDSKALDVQSQSISPEFADGEYNEWFGKIYDIIYSKWHPSFDQDAEVLVLLRITDTGSFYYRVARLSSSQDYNHNIINLLDSLKQTKFPPYPKGKIVEIEVSFRSKPRPK